MRETWYMRETAFGYTTQKLRGSLEKAGANRP